MMEREIRLKPSRLDRAGETDDSREISRGTGDPMSREENSEDTRKEFDSVTV